MSKWEDKLVPLISKIPGLKTRLHRAEFGSHIGFGYLFCGIGGGIGFAVWVTGSVLGELVADGHLQRWLDKTQTDAGATDFFADVVSRAIGPALWLWLG